MSSTSETGVIDVLGGEYIRDLEPGGSVIVKDNKMESHMYSTRLLCRLVYLSIFILLDPNATIDGQMLTHLE